MADQRVSAHRLRRRVARRARWIAGRIVVLVSAVAVLGAAALGAAWVVRSPRFAVTSVEVAGQSRLTREQIVAAAGIPPGTNLFALDTRAVVARLESLPLVRRAEVIRSFPNRVTVIVEERRPFTVVHAGRLHWIDEAGVDLGVESRPVPLDAPVLSGLGADDLGGEGQGTASERAALGISLLRLLLRARSPLLGQISEIDELAIRLPTKPGTSPQRIGILRMAWAKLAAACIVSGAVSSPSITSIRRIIEAG